MVRMDSVGPHCLHGEVLFEVEHATGYIHMTPQEKVFCVPVGLWFTPGSTRCHSSSELTVVHPVDTPPPQLKSGYGGQAVFILLFFICLGFFCFDFFSF